jgi:hypothetical protein
MRQRVLRLFAQGFLKAQQCGGLSSIADQRGRDLFTGGLKCYNLATYKAPRVPNGMARYSVCFVRHDGWPAFGPSCAKECL